ncbi:hypothetical protein QFC19_004774 [Naganishia cerealis]|uniref:Uncharacterized protein n=1 Tax=Naganishia cerealis TaxID=610337 RepID=A0ACC2VU92_9TREE|nr:hypothetical protein QFC19_004774 [Naganishia cerealis]
MSGGATWETTRKHARALESRLDAKLSAYSALAGQITTSHGGSLTRDGSTSPTRNRDVMSLEEEGVGGYKLMEEEIDELLEKSNIEQALQRHDLLGSIRKDINAYKQSLPPQTDALLAERDRIDSSNRMTDEILEQAYATREDFAQQRTMLTGINSRITGVLSKYLFPSFPSFRPPPPGTRITSSIPEIADIRYLAPTPLLVPAHRFNARYQLAPLHDPV